MEFVSMDVRTDGHSTLAHKVRQHFERQLGSAFIKLPKHVSLGRYGPGCAMVCGKCADESACHHISGYCESDCFVGLHKPHCSLPCTNGTYGINCQGQCGHCNGTCHVIDGHCPWGCKEGYNGRFCAKQSEDVAVVQGVSVATMISVVIAAVVITTLGFGVVLFCLRKRGSFQKGSGESFHTDMVEPTSQSTPEFSAHAQCDSHVSPDDYAVLGEGTLCKPRDYEDLQKKTYENI